MVWRTLDEALREYYSFLVSSVPAAGHSGCPLLTFPRRDGMSDIVGLLLEAAPATPN